MWRAPALVAGRGSIFVDQIHASTNAQMPMKTSMKTLTVVVAPTIQPGWYDHALGAGARRGSAIP